MNGVLTDLFHTHRIQLISIPRKEGSIRNRELCYYQSTLGKKVINHIYQNTH